MKYTDNMPGCSMSGREMPASDNPATKAYAEANDRMHKDMVMNFTGDADVDFLRGMIPHHPGRLTWCRWS